ncbi:MAG TPA: hypothetical protein PLV07_05245, partial [Acidiphilium sp.]|nr:hypothetical protein [Acidiphilium sp.]
LALAVTLVQAFLLARTEPLGLGVVPLVQPILLALAQALLVEQALLVPRAGLILGAQLILGAGLVLGAGTAGGERGEAGRGEHENGAAGRAERSRGTGTMDEHGDWSPLPVRCAGAPMARRQADARRRQPISP